MHIISKRPLRDFWRKHPDAQEPLENWFKEMTRSRSISMAQIRGVYPHCDIYGDCFIFNIGGNKYRLVVKINFEKQMVYVRHILTHKEYDREAWKNDC